MAKKRSTGRKRGVTQAVAIDPARRTDTDSIRLAAVPAIVPSPDDLESRIDEQALEAFLDAVAYWTLDEADAARLLGVEPAVIEELKSGKLLDSEEIIARITMTALIRTALDIYFPPSISAVWMTLPNEGYPYCGSSPVRYIGEHGWPGLFWVLRQTQGYAVGN